MARSKKQKRWTGILAKPIDVNALIAGADSFEEFLRRLHQSRVAKLPELGRQLGMKIDAYDLTTPDGLVVFYTDLAFRLVALRAMTGSRP